MKLFRLLGVETIGSCNRTCTSCLRQSYPSDGKSLPLGRTVETKVGRGAKMPTETFKSIVDQASALGFSGVFLATFYNEPLLDERLPELLRYVQANLKCSNLMFNTNCDLMTPEVAKQLDWAGLEINIALYMPHARRPARERELRGMFRRATLRFRSAAHSVMPFAPLETLDQFVRAVIDQPCRVPNEDFYISNNGAVCRCCADVNADFDLGNVNTDSLEELWFGQKNRQLMATLSKPGGRKNYALCSVCPRPYGGPPAKRLQVVQLSAS